jgi:hypothetical protein
LLLALAAVSPKRKANQAGCVDVIFSFANPDVGKYARVTKAR